MIYVGKVTKTLAGVIQVRTFTFDINCFVIQGYNQQDSVPRMPM